MKREKSAFESPSNATICFYFGNSKGCHSFKNRSIDPVEAPIMESQTVFEAKRNYKTPSFSCKGPFIPMYKPVTTEFVPTGNFDPATFAYYCFCFSAGAVL